MSGPGICRLTPKAEEDLAEIWRYTARVWSPDQADSYLRGLEQKFAALCRNPELARERPEIVPPVRLSPHRAHLVIYRIEGDAVVILRVVHNRRNWIRLLDG